MAKNVLFFVHGIGRHGAGWAREEGGPIETLKKAAQCYESFQGLDLENELEMVEVRYDDIFDAHLDQWAALADELTALPGGVGIFNEVSKLLSQVGDDRNVFASLGGDVLLYTGFDVIAKRVRLRVNSILSEQIYKAQQAAKNRADPNPEFAIIGHSLGTTIVHDSLEQLATNQWLPDDEALLSSLELTLTQQSYVKSLITQVSANPYAPPHFIWDAIFMVCNTSRLLCQAALDPYQSSVKPGVVTRNFINVDHKLDPISKVKQFRMPATWEGGYNVEVEHIHNANINGFGHYLQHPSVHRLLFRLLVPVFTVTCNNKAKQLARDYPQWGDEFMSGGPRVATTNKLQKLVDNYTETTRLKLRELLEEYTKKVGLLS